MSDARPALSWLYDDLLAWLSPGGLLLTALALRFPRGLHLLRAQAPELTLPTWFAGAYAIGLALSPLGRLVYDVARLITEPQPPKGLTIEATLVLSTSSTRTSNWSARPWPLRR